ncbi:MAG: OmpA family protein, partial [Deltaproteobacteria bacterium]|nr:OmpA family protein [Deltaproteobacteria bacterium]
MSADKKSPPLIKKIIKKGHGGHHGGSWKVAYADFVTAMMAFFLVMWLLAISSEQGKAALVEYYKELTLSDAIFNGGVPENFELGQPGVLTGGCFELRQMGQELDEREKALDEREKALTDRRDSRPDMGATRPTDRDQNPDLTDLPEGVEGGEGSTEKGIAPGEGIDQGTAPGQGPGYQLPSVTPGHGSGSAEQARQAKEQLVNDLYTAVNNSLGNGGGTEGQFMVEYVPGGLKIQLLDKEGRPLFVSGQPRLTPLAQLILTTVAERLSTIPNKIAIEGHTDAVATISQEMTNWELSTARASAARRFLSRHGINDQRLTMVAGYASTLPLPGTNPTDPINRRVAIMIWDEPPKPDQTVETGPTEPPNFYQNGTREPQGTPQREPQRVQPNGSQSVPPPAAGGQVNQPRQPQPSVPRPATPQTPARPSQESLEQMLLEETLRKAASPDTSTSGPPL